MLEKQLIDAKPLMENGWHLVKTGESNSFLAQVSLADIPTVDAVEVVHGRWKFDADGDPHCSVCGKYAGLLRIESGNYCPGCGAKMDGGNEDGN